MYAQLYDAVCQLMLTLCLVDVYSRLRADMVSSPLSFAPKAASIRLLVGM